MPDRISKSNAQKSENAVASLPGSPVKSAVSPAISSPASGPAVSATTAKPRNANSETPTQARTARADSGVALEVAEAAASANRAVPDLAALTLHDAPAEQLTMTRAQLVEPSDENRLHLVEVLKQRVAEGLGECFLELGIDDEGKSLKFTDAELALAISNLSTASSTIDCIVTPLLVCLDGRPLASDESSNLSMPLPDTVPAPSKRAVKGHTAHVLVRKRSLNPADATEIRIAVVGNVDAGKSTLLGVLTKDVLDDGRGKARVNLFKHKHEIETGRTSSVGLEIMGFDECGRTVTPALLGRARPDWQDIGTASSKVISFHDLAGHEKYLKTTVFGMSGSDPHFAMLMIGANAGMVGMTKEHLGLALCLNLPVFVVVTKIDMCPPNVLESTLRTLTKVLKSSGCRKIPMAVRTMEESLSVAGNFVGERVCPIFQVSNVTGEGLPILRAFLNAIRAPGARGRYDPAKPVEFTITDLFSVPGVGTVVSGTLLSGVISAGDTVVIGPDSTGNFMTTQVKSVQRKRINVPNAIAGQSASLAVKRLKRNQLRKGMVILPPKPTPIATMEFEAEVAVLFHSSTISSRYQAMMHSSSIRQSVRIVQMEKEVLRTGDRALVRFRFMQRPEYLLPGARILLREGRTKCVGKVLRVFPYEKVEPLAIPAAQNGRRVPPNFPAGSGKVRRRTGQAGTV